MQTPERTEAPAERVLIVEDDASLGDLLRLELGERGVDVRLVTRAEDALELLETWAPELVISDMRLPGMDGIGLLDEMRARSATRETAVVLITAFGTVPQAVEALKRGADDFVTKPLDLEHLWIRVERLLDVQRLRRDVLRYRKLERGSFHGMLGRSATMRALADDIRAVAEGRGSVLVLGESGTGKELVARAIHAESPRSQGPFVPVNCAGIPPTLMESELFGHESGAFTGATKTRLGLFAEAQGGTVLLDEVGELPLELQAKLLRVLQDGTVRRVGANKDSKLNVRVLAATHRDLEKEVAEGRFREDLYYRLATFVLKVPPLRARREDIPLLAAVLLERVCAEIGKSIDGFDQTALAILKDHPFPGNVRELANVVEHAATFCQDRLVTAADLPDRIRDAGAVAVGEPAGTGAEGASQAEETPEGSDWVPRGAALATLDEVCVAYVRHVLSVAGWNKRRAAALLGISRRTLYRYLDRMG